MKETVKTLAYVAVAVAVALFAALTYPRQEDFEPPDLVGKALFKEFTDPAQAAELRIVRFREDVGELTEFEVARDPQTGLWVIPSSANYPADAAAQMRDAATSLIDLQVLDVASESASDHETYGVKEPTKMMDASQEGVGLLVDVKDAKEMDLAQLIIGKLVKGEQEQHFVRKPGIDSVYVVKIDAQNFPTNFERWIERNLLKINQLDVTDVTLRNYSIIRTQTESGTRGRLENRFQARVAWDADDSRWRLEELVRFRNNQPIPTPLRPTEELNAPALNDLKYALSEMQIIGVARKPTGLGEQLRSSGEFLDNEENRLSLMSRGFYPLKNADGKWEIRAANGEALIGLTAGVQYVLRFGEIVDVARASEEGKLSRYLFVSAQVDDSKFPPLELEPLPGEGTADSDAAADADAADWELQREKIRKENQRKQDERDEKLTRARQIAADLNARFADWYYIVSEDEYKRIHLRRNDLIQESAAAKEIGFGIDAFRQLQLEGLPEKPEN